MGCGKLQIEDYFYKGKSYQQSVVSSIFAEQNIKHPLWCDEFENIVITPTGDIYEYNLHDRSVKVSTETTKNTEKAVRVQASACSFKYDGRGRRISKTFNFCIFK